MEKVLFLGGSGFIGKNFLEQLENKYQIEAPTHNELDLLNASSVKSFLSEKKFDVVIFSANVGGTRNASDQNVYELNKSMFLNVAENHDYFGKLLNLGSGAEYGKQLAIVKAKESDFGKVKPEDEYGRAKYFVSEYIESQKNMVSLRCFGVFGKYEDYAIRFISQNICRALFKLPIVVNQDLQFSYLYINDLIKILDYFISHTPNHKFYNTAGENVSLLETASFIASQLGVEVVLKAPGLGKEYTGDSSLLLSEVESFSFTPIKTAVAELIEWYKNNLKNIDKSKLDFDA